MKTEYLTEQQWAEVYNEIFHVLLKVFLKNGRTEEEARNTMEKIKEIFVKEPHLEKEITLS